MKTVDEIEQGAKILINAALDSGIEIVICIKKGDGMITCLDTSSVITAFAFAGVIHIGAGKRVEKK